MIGATAADWPPPLDWPHLVSPRHKRFPPLSSRPSLAHRALHKVSKSLFLISHQAMFPPTSLTCDAVYCTKYTPYASSACSTVTPRILAPAPTKLEEEGREKGNKRCGMSVHGRQSRRRHVPPATWPSCNHARHALIHSFIRAPCRSGNRSGRHTTMAGSVATLHGWIIGDHAWIGGHHAWLHSLIGDLVRVGAGGHPGVRDAALRQDQVPLVGGEGGRTRVMALWGVCVRSLQVYKAIRKPIAEHGGCECASSQLLAGP